MTQQPSVVEVWGSDTPRRELLHVDDLADACVCLMNLALAVYASKTEPMRSPLNVGTGVDLSIRELAELYLDVTGFQGELRFDPTKPDGTPRKRPGWRARTNLRAGLAQPYAWYLSHFCQFATLVLGNAGLSALRALLDQLPYQSLPIGEPQC